MVVEEGMKKMTPASVFLAKGCQLLHRSLYQCLKKAAKLVGRGRIMTFVCFPVIITIPRFIIINIVINHNRKARLLENDPDGWTIPSPSPPLKLFWNQPTRPSPQSQRRDWLLPGEKGGRVKDRTSRALSLLATNPQSLFRKAFPLTSVLIRHANVKGVTAPRVGQ